MELHAFLRAVMGLAVVLALLMLFAVALRRWGGKLGLTAMPMAGTKRTITVLESAMLDTRHRLVRVRIENREHLFLLGGASPVVVESKNSEGSA